MKTNLLLLSLTVVVTLSVKAQSQKETIPKTASFRGAGVNRVLSVANIQGDVIVEAYKGTR